MWNVLLTINSVFLALASLYLVYSLGTAFVLWSWKQFVIALVIFIFFSLTEVALDGMNEW